MNEQEYILAAKKYREELYRFAVRYTGDGDSAWDIVQDALVTMWQHCDTVQPSQAKGYLVRTMYHKLVDQHRRVECFNRNKQAFVPEEIYTPHDNFVYDDETQLALDHLTDLQRTVLLLKDVEGYHYKEIAQITGMEESQVTGLLYRARIEFKKQYLAYSKKSNTALSPLTIITI